MSDLVAMAVDKFSPCAAANSLVTGLIGLTSGCFAKAMGDEPVTGRDGVVTGAEKIASIAMGFLEVASEPNDILEIVL